MIERTLRIRCGIHGGAAPEIGMVIEDPDRFTDKTFVVIDAKPDPESAMMIATDGMVPAWMYSDTMLVTVREATQREIDAWEAVEEKRYPKPPPPRPWWRFWS